MRALVIACAIAITAHAGFAQPAPSEPVPEAACFPTCRTGYACRAGTCVADDAPADFTHDPIETLAEKVDVFSDGSGSQ